MSHAGVILEPVTYNRKRRSLSNALVEAGLDADTTDHAAEEAIPAVLPKNLVEMEASTTGVFEAVGGDVRTRTTSPRTRTTSRRLSNWLPIGYRPEPMPVLEDPSKASELPWLKAKRKGRFLRKFKVFTAWVATLLFTAAVLAGTASVMGLYPWLKGAVDTIARQ